VFINDDGGGCGHDGSRHSTEEASDTTKIIYK
jgi:hypothetical protein